MPEVTIYDAPDVNAFATGMNRNDALVAVSTGLLPAKIATFLDDPVTARSAASSTPAVPVSNPTTTTSTCAEIPGSAATSNDPAPRSIGL